MLWNKDATPVIGVKGQKYGLQPAPKDAKPRKAKLGVFGDADDDDEDGPGDRNAAVRAQQGVKRGDAKVKAMYADALAEDPNLFDYDSFHDTLQNDREAAKQASFKTETAGPKYIYALMAAKKNRDREQDLLYERRLARDRKAEDKLHGDKEQFVTAAYKKKLEEDQLWAASLEAKDKADEERTAGARGMDGFLGVLQSALADASAAQVPADDGKADGKVGPSGAGGAPSLDADLQRRAELQLKKHVSTMDKYELKRHQMETMLAQQRDAAGGHDREADGEAVTGPGPPKAEGDGWKEGGGAGPGAEAAAVETSKGAPKRRADSEAISAAKARALERKRARLQGS